MKCVTSSRRVALAAIGAALLLGLAAPAQTRAQARNWSELTAQWWKWVLSIPAPENPLFDETGEDAGVGQPYQGNKVIFLCGVFNATGAAERSITVPQGTAFFFPLLNAVEFIDGHTPGNPTVAQMYADLKAYIDQVDHIYVTVDGADLTGAAERVRSRPFAILVPDDNVFGAPAGSYAPAVSDGWWFALPPLTVGTHTLRFGGSNPANGGFVLDLTYHITVK